MTNKPQKIGVRQVRALAPGEIVWDSAVVGFCARRQRGIAVTYYVKYRTATGRQRWQVIGRHGSPWTPDDARSEAQRILGVVVDGKDPAAEKRATRKAETVGQLCDLYLADAEAGRLLTRRKVAKKASTLATDRGRIIRHIKPQLGAVAVAAVTREDIERFMYAVADGQTAVRIKTKTRGLARVSGGQGTASRTVGLLGAIFTYSVRHRMRSDNPVHGVIRFADGRRDRRLSDDEYAAFGEALRSAQTARTIWPAAIGVTRFLTLTGWRSGEALGLKWRDLDLVRRIARLPDTKTGLSIRPLSHAACAALVAMRQFGSGELVFPATRGDSPMSGFPKMWARIAKLGGLPSDITPHTARHSFASLAGDLGYSEPTIGALIGHRGQTITSRYIHSADAVLLAAADAVANRTAELMGDAPQEATIVPIRAGA